MIDGLQSAFTHSASSALLVVLKALSNRKHIYVVNLSDSYDALKERERQQREAEGEMYFKIFYQSGLSIFSLC